MIFFCCIQHILGTISSWFTVRDVNTFLAFQERIRQRMLDSCTVCIWPGSVFSCGNREAELIKSADIGRKVCFFAKLHSTQTYMMAYRGSSLVNEILQTPWKMPLHGPAIWLLSCQERGFVLQFSFWLSHWWDLNL